MTRDELSKLGSLDNYIREWREEDRDWKKRVEDRLTSLEKARIESEATDIATERLSAQFLASTQQQSNERKSDFHWRMTITVGFIASISAAITGGLIKVFFGI